MAAGARAKSRAVDGLLSEPLPLDRFAKRLTEVAQRLAGDAAWRGPAGRMAAELLGELQAPLLRRK